MGALTLPAAGKVYVDTALIIYSVERVPSYELLAAAMECARLSIDRSRNQRANLDGNAG